jgi:DNA invertase Pin-like site-specific DNA recombinase
MYQMMGVFAEFERAMIRERVKAGLDRARAQGNALGLRWHYLTYLISKVVTPSSVRYGPCFIPGGRHAYIPFVK